MLTIRTYGFCDATDGVLLDEVKTCVEKMKNADDGRSVFLLVPEQQTVDTEKEALAALSPRDTLYFEVTNFSRLCNTVFRKVGGVGVRYADKTSKALLMWKTLYDLGDELTAFGNRPTATHVAKALVMMNEVNVLGLTSDALKTAAEADGLKDADKLKKKLRDLSLLVARYRDKSGDYADGASDAEALYRALSEDKTLLSGCHFFLDGFTSFTVPQLKILRLLLSRADVTVYLCLPRTDRHAFHFAETRATREALLRICDGEGVEKREPVIAFPPKIKDAGFAQIVKFLWHETAPIDGEDLKNTKDVLSLWQATSPYEEAAFLTSDIQRRVAEGAKYADFAVVARNGASLDGVLKSALNECGIPFFLSDAHPLSSYLFTKMISAAYMAVVYGFRADDVFAFAKCGFTEATPDEVSNLEIYVSRYRLSGRHLTLREPWAMNPAGFGERETPETASRLAKINETRDAVMRPLLSLAEKCRVKEGEEPYTVREQATHLFAFLTEISLEEKLRAEAKRLALRGDGAAHEVERLYDVLLGGLDTLVEVLGELRTDTRSFADILGILFSTLTVGNIPPHVDEVTLGVSDTVRLSDKKHVYLLDVNEGVFPQTVSEASIFTDKEKALLSALDMPVGATLDVALAREEFSFSRVLAAGTESVTLLSTERDAALKECTKSQTVEKIEALTGGAISLTPIASLPEKTIYTPLFATSFLSGAHADAVKAALGATKYRDRGAAAGGLQNKALTLDERQNGELYPTVMRLSNSQMEAFLKCPFMYYCDRNLTLDKQEAAEFKPLHIGNIVHRVMEVFFRRHKDGNYPAGEARAAEVRAIAEGYVRTLTAGDCRESVQISHFLDKLYESTDRLLGTVVDELSRPGNRFRPILTELSLGREGDEVEGLTVTDEDGNPTAEIVGKVDRVDTFQEGDDLYVRVMDYKTGGKEFKPTDVENGDNLQMFLYMRALAASETFRDSFAGVKNVIPAGVFYIPMKADGETAEAPHAVADRKPRYLGMVLADEAVTASLDSDFFPLAKKKDGSYTSATEKVMYTPESFAELGKTMDKYIGAVAADIRGGNINATPLMRGNKSSCEYCSFKFVCRSVQS